MKHLNEATKTFRVFKSLISGNSVNAEMALMHWGVKNLSAEISRIRARGYPIYVDQGQYSIGQASRRMVRGGYLAIKLNLV